MVELAARARFLVPILDLIIQPSQRLDDKLLLPLIITYPACGAEGYDFAMDWTCKGVREASRFLKVSLDLLLFQIDR